MKISRKIVLVPQGSLGDLHPILALGLALRDRGAEVLICSHPYYRAKVEKAGLRFKPIGPDRQQFERDLGIPPDEIIRRMSRDHAFLLNGIIAPYLEAWIAELLPVVREADLVVGNPLTYAAHIAAKLCGKPYVTGALMPAVLMSAYDPPKSPEGPFFTEPKTAWQREFNRTIFRLARLKIRGGLTPIRKIYKQYKMQPQEDLGGVVSDDMTLALFSPLLADPQPDHPPNTHIAGFPFYDSEDGSEARLSAEVETFLSKNKPPIVYSLGSMAILNGEGFYRESIRASKMLGEPCIVLVGDESPLLHEDFGPDVLVTPYAPHSLLYPNCRAIVHHGGIGSTAQALRAGRPALITPVFADQFDNAHRVSKLGAARALNFDDFTAETAVEALSWLINNKDAEKKAAEFKPIVEAETGADRGAQILLDAI